MMLLTNEALVKKSSSSDDRNLIPLINIVFLLLIFFMVAGSIQATAPSEISLPDITADNVTASLKDNSALQIYLDKQERLYLSEELMSLQQLDQHLQNLTNNISIQNVDVNISLSVDQQVLAVQLDKVLNVIRSHQVASVNLLAVVRDR